MGRRRTVTDLLIGCLAAGPVVPGQAAEWSGYFSLEPRYFFDAALFDDQPGAGISPSAVAAPELRFQWHGGRDRVTVAPFLRVDADDSARSHLDVREALWQHTGSRWAWRVGIGRVFWGVTESRHLVDVVNQTDLVEDLDEEDKLGQPMIHAERWSEIGTFGVFLLPGFRERTFPDESARLRGAVGVDTASAVYQSGAGNRRTDVAVRWFEAVGRWDLGISAFYGTSREPRLVVTVLPDTEPVLVPHYDVISQLGVDVQYTRGAWLWKLEALTRRGQGSGFGAAVAGFEYTAFNVAGAPFDLGLLVEYLHDGRGLEAPPTVYDDDWFGGFRWSFNDVAGTSILGGAIVDDGAVLGIIEAERRLGSAWKLEVEVRGFTGVSAADRLLRGFRHDSFVTLRLARYL